MNEPGITTTTIGKAEEKKRYCQQVWRKTCISGNKLPVKKYFEEVKPLICLQRAFGELPYSIKGGGFAPFKLLSLPVLYTVAYLTVQFTWTTYSLHIIVKEKIHKAASYDIILYWVSISIFLLLNFTVPITRWIDSRRFIQHVRRWQDFQDNHLESELKAHLTLLVKMVALSFLPIASAFVYCQSYLLTDLSLLVMVPYICCFVGTGAVLIHWSVVLYELRAASRTLLRQLISDGCRQTSTYRKTWLELSKLTSGVGESFGYTGLAISTILFVTFVLTTYALLSSIVESANSCNHCWGLLINAIISILCNFLLFNAAHLTTTEVGPDFSSKILALDLTHLNQVEINEFSLLLQTMSANPPTVEYLGFVTVNRNLFVSLISNAVTYLVVLIQFKSSAPVKPINE